MSLWTPVAAFMALLFSFSSQSDVGSVPPGWDKTAHLGAYCILGVLALRACHGGLHRLRPGPTVAAILITVGYGLLDEVHQIWTPGRRPSLRDWLADAAGALCAVVGLLAYGATRRATGPATTDEDS